MSETDPYADITPDDSTLTFLEFLGSDNVRLTQPEVSEGGPCFDFKLPIYDFSSGSRVATDEVFHLQQAAANGPVALLFGSYT